MASSRTLLFPIIISFFLGLFTIYGCNDSGNSGSTAPSAKAPQNNGGENASMDGNEKLTDFEQFVKDNNDFSLDLYHQISATEKENNIFISPYSVSCAMAMAYAGARGDTETQMAKGLRFSFPQDTLHGLFKCLYDTLNQKGAEDPEPFKLYVSNALWGQEGFGFLPTYLDLVSSNYGSEAMNRLDFKADPEGARITINDWVYEKTEALIENLIPENMIKTSTRLVITNTIYFLADWLHPFKPEETTTAPFHLATGDLVEADMMTQLNGFPYTETDTYQAVELPYIDKKTAMIIVLPAAGAFDEVEQNLDAEGITQMVNKMTDRSIGLSLPKYSYGYCTEKLKNKFIDMGITDAFGPGTADFSGITGQKELSISDIVHKAFVRVDEKGTEAAAATAIAGDIISIPKVDFLMTVDRPFFFFILDKETTSILFMGRVMNPGAGE